MAIGLITGVLLKKAGDKAMAPVVGALEAALTNQQALGFAKARLRERFEPLLLPTSFEHVTDNLRLVKEDFIEYYRQADEPTAAGLEQHLLARLRERAADWVHNKPTMKLFEELVIEFYRAYRAYFVTTDPQLATLHLIDQSGEALEMIADLRFSFQAIERQLRAESPSRLALDLVTMMQVLNVPFDVVETSDQHVEMIITEPSAILPTRFYVATANQPFDTEGLGALRQRAERRGHFSHIVLLTVRGEPQALASAAAARGIQIATVEDFRARFMALGPLAPIVLGALASRALLERYNVHEVFIEPDAVMADPGDHMEAKYLRERSQAMTIVRHFLERSEVRILFVLGGYGSGKSAFAAHLTAEFDTTHVEWTAACVPLSRITPGDQLTAMVARASQLIAAARSTLGRSLVILDGLDELPNAMDPQEKRTNILRLLEVAQQVDKLVVTVRTSYFRGLDDFWSLFDTGKREGYWADVVSRLSGGLRHRSAKAMVLREFDSRQIATYVERTGQARGARQSFTADFFTQMKAHDPQQLYRNMARSPLYLYLLVNTQPWKNKSVTCFIDVVETFVRYWLARDIEKGPSRWLLTPTDRFEFAAEIGWWMFSTDKQIISFAEFEEFVRRFFADTEAKSLESMALDLQTTGIFTCVGGVLYFALPAFLDFFVVMRFIDGCRTGWPPRLPTPTQARLWLAYVESKDTGDTLRDGESDTLRADVAAWLAAMGVDPNASAEIDLPATGLVYGTLPKSWRWPVVNSDSRRYLRAVIRKALAAGAPTSSGAEGVIDLIIANRLGLHARATARMVGKVEAWLKLFPEEQPPVVALYREGEEVDAKNLLGLLLMSVGSGSEAQLRYSGCSQSDIEDLLEAIGGSPADDGSRRWSLNFGEDQESAEHWLKWWA